MLPNEVWKDIDRLRVDPFSVLENLFYVGNADTASYLLRTEEGCILIDTGFASTVPLLLESIEKVGNRPSDIRMIMHTHGHVDHCGGTRRMVELTGARTCIHARDRHTVEQGTPMTCAAYIYGIEDFEPFAVDVAFQDGEHLSLGSRKLEVLHTPGHTPGGCTFILTAVEAGRTLSVVLWGCPGLWTFQPEHRSQGYDGDIAEYAESLQRLKRLTVDVPISPHPGQDRMLEKAQRARVGASANPFIDRRGWRRKLRQTGAEFRRIVALTRRVGRIAAG